MVLLFIMVALICGGMLGCCRSMWRHMFITIVVTFIWPQKNFKTPVTFYISLFSRHYFHILFIYLTHIFYLPLLLYHDD